MEKCIPKRREMNTEWKAARGKREKEGETRTPKREKSDPGNGNPSQNI
jgi:hypothetical protein